MHNPCEIRVNVRSCWVASDVRTAIPMAATPTGPTYVPMTRIEVGYRRGLAADQETNAQLLRDNLKATVQGGTAEGRNVRIDGQPFSVRPASRVPWTGAPGGTSSPSSAENGT